MGDAIHNEIITSPINSFDNKFQILNMEAPTTFRTPISLVRCPATKLANPKRPRQEINMARMAKKAESLPMRCSWLNFFAYSSSANR